MVVHCKTEDEAKELIECANMRGYSTFSLDAWRAHRDLTCYRFSQLSNGKKIINYCNTNFYLNNGYKITEFSDLIIPEEQEEKNMSAEEVVAWLCEHYNDGEYRNAFGQDYHFSDIRRSMTPSEIVHGIEKWKSAYEKPKEPETEWVCRVFDAENYGEKFFRTEEDAIRRCEELAKLDGNQCTRYERVCRVKGAE
jgi:hypothetical protein